MTGVAVYVNSTTADFACVAAGDTTLTDGEKDTYTCATGGLTSGKFKGALNIDYVNSQTTMAHTKVGELILKIS
jgi:expansin (peptidoglycan-binding protein)